MKVSYSVTYSKQFAKEFVLYPEDQQRAIFDFVSIYEKHGLDDFSLYPGKITPSWKNATPENEAYARQHRLWHYHVGIPIYKRQHDKYLVSDWLLHFQRESEESIRLVDIYDHNTKTLGKFYLPSEKYLD